jgi:hypothetical protein
MSRWRRYAAPALVLVAFLGQVYFLQKYLVLGERRFLYPDHFVLSDAAQHKGMADRFLSFGAPVLGNVALDKHVFSPDGIDPAYPSRYGELIYAAKNDGRYVQDIPRIEANLSEYAENTNIYDNSRRQRLINLLGVTWVYNYESAYTDRSVFAKIFPPAQYTSVWERDGWRAYTNTAALPRVFFVDSYVVERDTQKTFNYLFDPSFDLRKKVVLSEKPSLSDTASGTADAEMTAYAAEHVRIRTRSESTRLLFLSDMYYPGWRARVDGQNTQIYRANYAFRAVVVPQGEHIVEFVYDPQSFRAGSNISGVTGFVLLMLLCFPHFFDRIFRERFAHKNS